MGKSLKNYIPVNDSPNDMFGKLMSIVDEVIFDYFELVTRVPMEDIEGMKQEVANGANPMAFKKELALNIVEFYHGKEEALKAQDHFQKTVQNKEVEMDDLLDITVKTNTSTILDVLKEDSGLSSGDLKRLITQGGVEIDGVKITDYTKSLELKSGMLIKVGKRKYFRVNLHQ
jgi:tyrosyl-tRNA synthetase